MSFSERIVDLVDRSDQGVGTIVTIIYTQRIENVTEYARHAQQPDRTTIGVEPRLGEQPFDIGPKGAARTVSVVGVSKGQNVEAVVREQPKTPGKFREFVKIEQHLEHPVPQPMAGRRESLVDNLAHIEAGGEIAHAAGSKTR